MALSHTTRQNISDILNILTGLIECFILLGLSVYFFYLINVLIDQGHFCPATTSHNNETSNIITCHDIQAQNQNVVGILITGLVMFNLPSFMYGFILDNFELIYVRIIILIGQILGYLTLTQTTHTNSFYTLYLVQIFIGFSNGILFIQGLRDLPQVIPKYENLVRSVVNSMVNSSGWFYWMVYKILSSSAENQSFEITDYAWVMLGISVILIAGRSFLWLRQVKTEEEPEYVSRLGRMRKFVRLDLLDQSWLSF